jgi:hypothetical protein
VAALKLVAGALVAYVLTRAAFIFLDWVVAVVVVALAIAAALAWRRGERPLAVGVVAGTALSLIALSL